MSFPFPFAPFPGAAPVTAGSNQEPVTIQDRLIAALNSDIDVLSLLPVGETVSDIDPRSPEGDTAVALVLKEQQHRPRTLGGSGVGRYQMETRLGLLCFTRTPDRGTPTKSTAADTLGNLTTFARESIWAHRIDSGTPRLWLNMRFGDTVHYEGEGFKQSITDVIVFGLHQTNQ